MTWSLVRISFLLYFRVRGAALGPLVFLVIMFAVEGSFWRSMADSPSGVNGYDVNGILLYAYAALVASQITAVSGEADSLAEKIEAGMLDPFLLRPTGFLYDMTSVQVGTCLARIVMLLPILVGTSAWISSEEISIARYLLVIPILVIGAILNFLINSILSTLTFFFRASYAFVALKETLFWVLSGALIPLDLFPDWMSNALAWFPPAYVVYFPAKVFIGQADFATIILGSIIFTTFAAIIFGALWRFGVKRYQAFGG